MALTGIEKANLRLKSAEIAIVNGTKVGLERDACLEAAEKIYRFAIGITEEKAPSADPR